MIKQYKSRYEWRLEVLREYKVERNKDNPTNGKFASTTTTIGTLKEYDK